MDSGIKAVSRKDPSYPRLLKETKNAPRQMFYRGVLPRADEPAVAIVGTRKATEEGKAVARRMAAGLSGKGFAIVSGLALGIDGAAHAGALDAGGRTIAVLGNGLESVYPASHEHLAGEIVEKGGCLISEYQPGEPPLPYKFLERNRIVAGLCIATVVVEAPRRSGALVTARFAAEEGREVFVVPGGARDRNYEGSHLLIRNGARLAADAAQVLEDLAGIAGFYGFAVEMAQQELSFDREEVLLLETLEKAGIFLTIDKLSEITHLETHIINQKLTFLLLAGIVAEMEGSFGLKSSK